MTGEILSETASAMKILGAVKDVRVVFPDPVSPRITIVSLSLIACSIASFPAIAVPCQLCSPAQLFFS